MIWCEIRIADLLLWLIIGIMILAIKLMGRGCNYVISIGVVKYACFTSIIHVKQNKTTVLHGGRLLPTSSDITAIQKCCIWHQKLLIRYWTIIGKPHSKDWAIIFNACLITKNLQGTCWISSSPLLTLAEHIHVLNQ